MNQEQWGPEHSDGPEMRALRAANPMPSQAAGTPASQVPGDSAEPGGIATTDDLVLRRIRARVMAELGMAASPAIPGQDTRIGAHGGGVLARARAWAATPSRVLLATAACAAAVMTAVIVWPNHTPSDSDLTAGGVTRATLKSAVEPGQRQDAASSALQSSMPAEIQAAPDAAWLSQEPANDRVASKLAVRESCFGDAAADAMQCGYPVFDYDTKQSLDALDSEEVGADVNPPLTVAVEAPRQTATYAERSTVVGEFETTVRVSNGTTSDVSLVGQVDLAQELLVDGASYACEATSPDTPWTSSASGTHPVLTTLRAGETASRSLTVKCAADVDATVLSGVTPRTLVDFAGQVAVLFRRQ